MYCSTLGMGVTAVGNATLLEFLRKFFGGQAHSQSNVNAPILNFWHVTDIMHYTHYILAHLVHYTALGHNVHPFDGKHQEKQHGTRDIYYADINRYWLVSPIVLIHAPLS